MATPTGAAAELVDFRRDIHPILVDRCFRCHGPDEQSREAGLRLDSRTAATAELDSGETAVVPGQPASSALIERVGEGEDDLRMPPPDAGPPLDPHQRELLWQWIEQGAVYARHWAFVPPQRPALPEVSRPAWVRRPTDRFVLAGLDKAELQPSAEADRFALARRASLALTGLPPTLAELEQLQAEAQAGWYEEFVERRLGDLARHPGVRTPVLRQLAAGEIRKTHIQRRGNFRAVGDEVTPGVPAALHALPAESDPDRLAIARWLVSDDNPLTARVVVNRYWAQLFGTGLVTTSGDFGRQGKPPAHPGLLDFLATELIAHDWDTKWLVREIVTSATYSRNGND